MQDENDKMRDNAGDSMLSFLERIHEEGAEFFVDGEAVLPEDAFARTVKEENAYMADYVFGETGRIEQVRFDKVNPE